MKSLLFSLLCGILLYVGVCLIAYMAATPGNQPLSALFGGMCLGAFAGLVSANR